METKKVNYYYYGDLEVVLLYTHEISGFLPLESGDIAPYELTPELLSYMNANNINECLTEDDSYSSYSEPEAIVESTFQNFENEQCLSTGWVRESYALMNEAHRELATTTNSYYEWSSEREIFMDLIFNRILRNEDLQDLESEWINICSSYSSPYDDDDISFNSLVEEARRQIY